MWKPNTKEVSIKFFPPQDSANPAEEETERMKDPEGVRTQRNKAFNKMHTNSEPRHI